jgi:hypothetical protein
MRLKGYDDLIERLEKFEFKPFGPAHSSKTGYELYVTDKRRACFYDNRIWGHQEIEFSVLSYEKDTNGEIYYQIFTIYFEHPSLITQDTISTLILVAKNLQLPHVEKKISIKRNFRWSWLRN